jgi:hypothetical protein
MTNLKLQPIDRTALGLIAVLAIAIGLLILGGDRSVPSVREFSWQARQVSATDRAFVLNFTRPMDRTSVERNLEVNPPLKGKPSWAGQRMVYTLDLPAPYGFEFEVKLAGAQDRFAAEAGSNTTISPFLGKFRSRDRAFAYISLDSEQAGRLTVYNMGTDQKTVLTPPDLEVIDYRMYPRGDRILFSAIAREGNEKGLLDAQLYTVTTGIEPYSPGEKAPRPKPAGQVRRVLDNREYQNLQFDLSPDGKLIVIQRVNRNNPKRNSELWTITEGGKPQVLNSAPGGVFAIAPNSQELAIAQGQGVAILPLTERSGDASKPLGFFPEYSKVFGFTRDGSAAVMVKYNPDFTESLYLVPSQGEHRELYRSPGSILSASFDPTGRRLYCLMADVVKETVQETAQQNVRIKEGSEVTKEIPYIALIDLESGKLKRLLKFAAPGLDVQVSVSPDGRALMFDQLQTAELSPGRDANTNRLKNSSGDSIVSGRLWLLLPLISDDPAIDPEPQDLPIVGFLPRWLP